MYVMISSVSNPSVSFIYAHTYTHTYTQDNYYNPRCAHAHRGLKIRRSEVTAHSSTSSCAYPHNKYAYLRSGCVRAGAYNLIKIFASYYIMLPGHGPGPGPVLCIDDS